MSLRKKTPDPKFAEAQSRAFCRTLQSTNSVVKVRLANWDMYMRTYPDHYPSDMRSLLLQEARIMGIDCSAIGMEAARKLGQDFWDKFLNPKRTVNRR
jgi:hypothetical protein